MSAHDVPLLPEGARGRFLACALTVLALAVLWLGIIMPLWGWYASRAQDMADRHVMLEHMQTIRDGLPELSRRVRAAGAQAAGTTILLTGGTDAVAGAQLQQITDGMLNRHGIAPTEEEAVQPDASGRLRRIGVRLKFQAQWADLVAFLRELETSRPRLFADDLHIQAVEVPDHLTGDTVETALVVMGFRAAGDDAGPPGHEQMEKESASGASDGGTK